MGGDVDADLVHGGYGFGADGTGFVPSAEHIETITGELTQDPFGHLTANRVAGTEDENGFLRQQMFLLWV